MLREYKDLRIRDSDSRNYVRVEVISLEILSLTNKDNSCIDEDPGQTQLDEFTTVGSYEYLQQEFFKQIAKGPTNICFCCGGLFYDESVKKMYAGLT